MSAGPDVDDSRTMRERMLAGDLYIADDPELAEDNPARVVRTLDATGR
ncbi:maltose acetyltransferase domain-containing protein [Geodermatophilus sabuli]|uniref:Maltose O-acetyltransferase n=1 Tax=Geodermatophilus sabuli TaxID=1564158 RepID=A0A285EAW0_9ACTN|nr:maltose acetyltransferase domain-containing protein [Geodermatophilus sabuli]MBB3085397.1 maltose O-acetyltransferase [Geodermatophilus sabuli]SNX96175.1 maltose O-acetyltransferase [Geodermatophilus sabuli]